MRFTRNQRLLLLAWERMETLCRDLWLEAERLDVGKENETGELAPGKNEQPAWVSVKQQKKKVKSRKFDDGARLERKDGLDSHADHVDL